jgi:hypothetical protein
MSAREDRRPTSSNAIASDSNGEVPLGNTRLLAVDSECSAFPNNAILSAGADGAAYESIGRFIDLVVDSLFKVCTCVAVDGTKDSEKYVRCRCDCVAKLEN